MTNDNAETTELLTLPEVARRLNITERRADYACRSRDIAPTRRVANIRLFDAAAVNEIQAAVERISAREPVRA